MTTAGLPFAKGHGTENDFVLLPDLDGTLDVSADLVRALCDRRSGIGGDGLLRVTRHGERWFMDYRNADGSIAEMCGNGVRVFARYLYEEGLVPLGPLTVDTRGGVKGVVLAEDSVTVDMGPPVFGPESAATLDGVEHSGDAVSMGNPHLVCPIDVPLADLDLNRAPVFDAGVFPEGVNVEFVAGAEPLPGTDLHVAIRVHERGVGETRSCGTGACAVAAAALRRDGLDRGTVAVDVPGGRVTVTLDGVTCLLTGPAVIVARGVLDRSWIDAALVDAAGSDAARSDAARSDAAGSDAARSDAARSDAAGTDAARSDAAGTDAARSDAAGTDAARSDAARSDAARSDAAVPSHVR